MITLKHVKNLPSNPGIYIFLKNNIPIYIGKSINIKARILSHINNAKVIQKENKIITTSHKIKYVITEDELSSILLEAFYIKKYKPQYNVIWKDDKKFLYIKCTISDTYPKFFIVRKENDNKSKYFGPFKSKNIIVKLLRYLRSIYPYCNQKSNKRKCFYSKIGLCNPCPSEIIKIKNLHSKSQLTKVYKKNIVSILSILENNTDKLINTLIKDINKYSKKNDFENAILLRDKLYLLQNTKNNLRFESNFINDVYKSENYIPLLQEFLKKYFFIKSKLISFRIECFDISTLFNTSTTGSMVVYENAYFNYQQYRRYKITKKFKSDSQIMAHVIMRRFNKNTSNNNPTLILLDGGTPQLRAVHNQLKKLKKNIILLGLAKNPDRLITINNNTTTKILLNSNSALFKLFQQIRDESHRFAKKYHIYLRSKNLMI